MNDMMLQATLLTRASRLSEATALIQRMLRGETEEVQRRLKQAMIEKYGAGEIEKHFRFFDTICGATQDRQDALEKLLREPLDLLLVIGGYNSSNTSHLAEMGEAKLPTFFIKNAAKMLSDQVIQHYDQHQGREVETHNWLPTNRNASPYPGWLVPT